MDGLQIAVTIGTLIVGSSGVAGIIRARRSTKTGLPDTEAKLQQAVSPELGDIAKHYRLELDKTRDELREEMLRARTDLKKEIGGLRRKVTHLIRVREIDAGYIDLLREHIMSGFPPPPPPRPQYPAEPSEET